MIFSLFISRVLQTYDINKKSVHWMTQHFFVECEGESIVDFVGRYEDLKIDWKYVANKLQISEDLPFEPVSYAARGAISLYGHKHARRETIQKIHFSEFYFNDTILRMVYDFYKRDVGLFGYDV